MAEILGWSTANARGTSITRVTRAPAATFSAHRSYRVTRQMKAGATLASAVPNPDIGQVWPRGNPPVAPG